MLRNRISNIYHNSLLKNTAVYVLSDAINKAVPFLILPVIVRYLTPEDYGIITNYTILTQIVSMFVIGVSQGSIPVHYFKMDKKEFNVYVDNIFSIAFVAIIIFSILFLLFGDYLIKILDLKRTFLVFVLFQVIFSAFVSVNMIIWRCEEKPTNFGVFQISQTILYVVLTITLVVILKLACEGKILAGLVSALAMGCLSIGILYRKKYYGFKIDFTKVRLVLVFALPLIPHALALWGKTGIDKVLITNFSGLAENGLYSTAITWSAVITMIITSFGYAYNPYLLKKLAYFDKNPSPSNHMREKIKIVKLSYMFVGGLGLFVFICYYIFYALIIFIYPETYHSSVRFLSWILLGEFFRGLYLIYINYIHYTYKTKVLGAITFSLSILQVGISYAFIMQFGTIGAAISSCLVSFLTAVGVGIYANRVYPMPWLKVLNVYGNRI